MIVCLSLKPIFKNHDTLTLTADVNEYTDGLIQHQVTIDKFCRDQQFASRIAHIDDGLELVTIFSNKLVVAVGNIYKREENFDRDTCEVQPE